MNIPKIACALLTQLIWIASLVCLEMQYVRNRTLASAMLDRSGALVETTINKKKESHANIFPECTVLDNISVRVCWQV